MKKQYQRIDVNIFREILKSNFCPTEEKGYSKKILIETIQEINKTEIILKGLKLNHKKEFAKINFREFGFKEQKDIKIEVIEDIFENKTIIILKPKTVYELEDQIELPSPSNNKQKFYLALMSDTFERIVIKADNILDETENKNHIELYASKNIQKMTRIFHEAKNLLTKIQKQNDNSDKFFVYVQTIFISNTILYLQKTFSGFYKDKLYSKKTLKSELCESIGINMFMEPRADYGRTEEPKIGIAYKKKIWNGNINILITLIYDLMQISLLDDDTKWAEAFIYNTFLNKNGKEISKETIRICLQKFREDKRAKGKKRIDISKYVDLDKS